ncbi:hypothetical protein CPB85DRAFT_1258041 [Mucidula mucida]|nr:hypothetical protein CPB85DRAFT_1258041 [Mucidula mucida]
MIALGAWAIPVLAGTGMGAPARLTTDVANMALLRRARKATIEMYIEFSVFPDGGGQPLFSGSNGHGSYGHGHSSFVLEHTSGSTLRKELICLEAILSTGIITCIGKFTNRALYSKVLVLYTYKLEQLALLYSNSNTIAGWKSEAESTMEDSKLKIS